MDIFLFIILMICGFVLIPGFYNAIKDNFFNNNNVNNTTKTSANTVSAPFSYRSEVQNLKNQIEEDKNKLSKYEKQLRENKQIIENLEYGLLEKDELYENLQKKTQKSVDFLTSMISDHNTLQEQLTEKYLKTKKQPAHNEAIRIKEIREISKLHIEKYKLLLYKYEYLLNIFRT